MMKFTFKMAALALFASMCSVQAKAENWITNLRDDVYVNQLSIPGTHDSGTGEGFTSSLFDSFARTQDLSLQGQWDSGIRAFDLRPTAVQTSSGERYLKIYHGIVETKIRFDEALRFLCNQVTENPGEFAIVIMRHETDGEKSGLSTLWEELVDECLNAEEFKGKLVNFRNTLKVKDMRGKVLVLSRDKYLGNKRLVGGYISGWTHSSEIDAQKQAIVNCNGLIKTSPLYVQDFYDCTGDRLATKLTSMRTMFQEAGKALSLTEGRRIWAINHASGYTKSASVSGNRENAASTHREALDYLYTCVPGTPTGIVMMDFAGVDHSGNYDVYSLALTRALITNNWPYEQNETGISDTRTDGQEISVADGCVSASVPVTVYDLSGRQVAAPATRVQLPAGLGVFMVRTASGKCRVMTR